MGAINRSALIASDYVVVPLGADLFSLRGLQNLASNPRAMARGLATQTKQLDGLAAQTQDNKNMPNFPLPEGGMKPIGYIMQQHGVRLERPVKAYDKWVNRMPEEYARNLLGNMRRGLTLSTPAEDPIEILSLSVKHYRSLIPMAQEKRKPIFHLTHSRWSLSAVHAAAANAMPIQDFKVLAEKIVKRINL